MRSIRMTLAAAGILAARLALAAGGTPVSSSAQASRPTTGPATMPAGSGAVSGKVVDADGNAVMGAEVSVYILGPPGPNPRMQTLAKTKNGKDGTFTITGLLPGADRRVWASFQVPRGPTLMGEARDLKIEAGKTLDVGAIKIEPATM